ncbi:MAG: pyridoxal phosphate-dependent aminotransferase [Bacteroidota bacterium]|jgi:histidinol-phosphate aminotransferase
MNRRELIRNAALAMGAFSAAPLTLAAKEFYKQDLWDSQDFPPGSIIKLSANENPHGPSPMAKKAMYDAVATSNRYQWDMNGTLREQIGKLSNHTKDHIILGAGSSELLGLITLWAAQQKGNIVAADPTFQLWMPAARKLGLTVQLVPVTAAKENDLPAMLAAINSDTRMVYLCNPNNPTGTVSATADLEQFIKKIPATCIILLDEAYTDYYDSPSMLHLVNDFPNLIIAKTFSKVYGMAGARLGYAVSVPANIQQLMQLQAWANAGPSYVSMQGGLASMQDKDFVAFVKAENIKAKDIFYKGLEQLKIPFIRSYTSFVYFDGAASKKDVPTALQAAGIVGARTFEKNTTWLRLSIGTVDEMQKVVAALL